MAASLLFIPDISGFTEFVQSTEAAHSQHVIAELLELLIQANQLDLQLAEIEGDALFFYKEEQIPSQEMLLAQIEHLFTAFYSHLKLLEKNRVCPCNACATAPNLQLKVIVHSGDLQFIDVQGNHKPFGPAVIEAHRLMKNSVESDNYVLFSEALMNTVGFSSDYWSKLFSFKPGADTYDGKELGYSWSNIDAGALQLLPYATPKAVQFDKKPAVSYQLEFPVKHTELLEYITNYQFRHEWVDGVDRFEYNENEVTRLGTPHTCVINGKHLDFTTVTKTGGPRELVYGELTSSAPILDELYQFYIIKPLGSNACLLKLEVYFKVRSPLKALFINLFAKKNFKKKAVKTIHSLRDFVTQPRNAD